MLYVFVYLIDSHELETKKKMLFQDGRDALLEICRSPSRNENALAEIALSLIEYGSRVDIKSASLVCYKRERE